MKYFEGQIVHVRGKITNEDAYVQFGSGPGSMLIPTEQCEIVWSEKPELKIGNLVTVSGMAYRDNVYRIIGSDSDIFWLKNIKDGSRITMHKPNVFYWGEGTLKSA
jgi:hypothetical protein